MVSIASSSHIVKESLGQFLIAELGLSVKFWLGNLLEFGYIF